MHFMHDVLKHLAQFSDPDRPIFKQLVDHDPAKPTWRSISYKTYLQDLNNAARFWAHWLKEREIKKSDVVGLWIVGTSYTDLVHIYALARAGVIPQVFNLGMMAQGSTMIEDLLNLRHGKVLIYDPYYGDKLHQMNVPTFAIPDLPSIPKTIDSRLDDLPVVSDEDAALIFHTSGTTSGRPKPIPQTHRWLRCQSHVSWLRTWQTEDSTIQKCFNNIGSFANVGSATSINYLSPSGQCLIQTCRPEIGATEFLALVQTQGLNNMLVYATWLSKLLAIARSDSRVFDALRSLQQITYTGEALNPEDLRWAIEKGIPVAALYATTETDNVKLTCADIVQNCVIVGTYKPIVLFVEPTKVSDDYEQLKVTIIKRMEPFNKGQFAHERIDSPLRVVVVEPGRLPRTKEKGNVRRKAVEETYAEELHEIYLQMADRTN
ncbi:hypothetical protein H0H93_015435 [Arthromyces matolae]|nr:hypothetical protein H0H93_015435 [Arthromyces matolae]